MEQYRFINVLSTERVNNLRLKRAFHGKVRGRVGRIGRALLSRGQLAIHAVSGMCLRVCM